MGMNVFAAQMAISAKAPSSKGMSPLFEPAKFDDAVSLKKSFGTVLRAVRQGGERSDVRKSDRGQSSPALEPRGYVKRRHESPVMQGTKQPSDHKRPEANGVAEQPSFRAETDSRRASAEDEAEKTKGSESTDSLMTDSEATDTQGTLSTMPTGVLLALSQTLPPQDQAVDPTLSTSGSVEPDNQKDGILGSADQREKTSLSAPAPAVMLKASVKNPATGFATVASTLPENAGSALDSTVPPAAVSINVPGQAEEWETPINHSRDAVPQLVSDMTVHDSTDDAKRLRLGAVSQEPPLQGQPVSTNDRGSQPEQELSRFEGAVPRSNGVPEQPVHQKQTDPAVLQRVEELRQVASSERGGEPHPVSVEMHRWPMSDTAAPSDSAWSHEGGDQQFSSDKMPWQAPEQEAALQSNHAAEHSAQVISAGNSMLSQARLGEPSAVAPSDRMQPSAPLHAAELHVSQMGRAVLFQLAEPDLGHINVRVALANEVVHAYLSSDRPEVGQVLINGQDRLQSALQAAGFDMGQFRVQVDRQGAQQQGGQDRSWRGDENHSQSSQRDQRGQEQSDEPSRFNQRRHQLGALSVIA